MPSPIDDLKKEFDTIATYLQENRQPSLVSDLNKNFRKILLLSAGSYFESEITAILSEFVKSKSNNDLRIVSFLQKQAISGKYFQFFDWGTHNQPDQFTPNANRFFSLFGEEFRKQIALDLRNQLEVTDAIKAFMEIGHLRNILVHSNFAAYSYE